MISIPERVTHTLTGRVRFRAGCFGRLIAQVEEVCEVRRGFQPEDTPPIRILRRWRDVKRVDVAAPLVFRMDDAK